MRTCLTEQQIQMKVQELACKISSDFKDGVVIVCVLDGAFMFCADLVRFMTVDVEVVFVKMSSYGDGKESSGEVNIKLDISDKVEGRHVLVVEDIVDTGLTSDVIMKRIRRRNPKSLKMASLLYKPSRIKCETTIDYLGFTIGDDFVVGYGMDYAGRYRHLPYIGICD